MKDGWRDERRKGVEEQTDAGRRWRQESNLVKSEWDVLFLNVERGRGGQRERGEGGERAGHSLGEKENEDGERRRGETE